VLNSQGTVFADKDGPIELMNTALMLKSAKTWLKINYASPLVAGMTTLRILTAVYAPHTLVFNLQKIIIFASPIKPLTVFLPTSNADRS
jgi:hypothetical protein